jgi:hypothetical protein
MANAGNKSRRGYQQTRKGAQKYSASPFERHQIHGFINKYMGQVSALKVIDELSGRTVQINLIEVWFKS